MQTSDRLDIVSFAGDVHITLLYERRKAAIRKRHIMSISKLAACLVFAVALIVAIRYITAPSPYQSDFVIRDGVLLSYTGTDTEVIIPDEVHTIGGKAFIQCSSVGSITSISIGPAVEKIAEDAFEGMTSLGTVNVSENNGYFIFSDGVLIATDGSICFSFKKDDIPNANGIVTTMQDIAYTTDYFIGKEFYFTYDGLLITSKCVEPLADNEQSSIVIESFSVFGQTFNIKDNKYGEGFYTDGVIVGSNGGVTNLYLSDDVFIYSKLTSSIGYTLIITKDNIYECINQIENSKDNPIWYNASFYVYTIAEDGRVIYTRQPVKYACLSSGYAYRYCVGFDEFALEKGYVSFKNGEIVHDPQEKYTAVEFFEMVKYPFDPNKFIERIEYNKSRYDQAH